MPPPGAEGTARCTLRESTGDKRVYALGRYLGRAEQLGPALPGQLSLRDGRLFFTGDGGRKLNIALTDITAIQPSSHALQIKTVRRPVFSIKFTDSSPKMWEERLQNAIALAYEKSGLGRVVEYQPRVCVPREACPSREGLRRVRTLVRSGLDKRPSAPWQYRLAAWIARNAWRHFGGGVEVTGLENIPERGPFLVLPNHQSYLETMLVPAVNPRPSWAMAKSTQFNVPFFGWLMAQVFAYPVRRFEIDPQAIRFTIRRFSEGYGVVIYAEGERTWDGDLQSARLGVARLALQTGVPVIPCRVEGAFDAWPRWSGKPQKNPVRISFRPALALPCVNSRQECEAQLDATIALIRQELEG